MKILWVLVNCNTVEEAKTMGKAALNNRLAACCDIFPRLATYYFWPPKSGKIETAKGCLLVMETLQKHFKELEKLIKKIHSDKLPFIGSVEIDNIHPNYMKWLRDELRR